MTFHVVGHGVVGSRVARLLDAGPLIRHDPRWQTLGGVTAGDVVVLAHDRPHAPLVGQLIATRCHVVSVGDRVDDVTAMLDLDREARDRGTTVIVGAAMSPGLSGLIARHLAGSMHAVEEIHVATHGTAGPSCARRHHDSLRGRSQGWHDGSPTDYVGGSGRELCWFPEPIGAKDCYRAAVCEPELVHRAFPEVDRISARRSARRRDRFTAWLPMLAPPHPEGGVGALRVELRGANADGSRVCLVAGVAELVGTATGATAAAFATEIAAEGLSPGVVVAGDRDLPTDQLLRRAEAFGVRLQEFTGVPQAG